MENIQVALRVRPQSFFEAENNDREVWQAIGPSAISINPDVHADLVKTKKMGFGHRSEFSFSKIALYIHYNIGRLLL